MLNYCQCQLELGEYYEVLEHTTDLLQKDNGEPTPKPDLRHAWLPRGTVLQDRVNAPADPFAMAQSSQRNTERCVPNWPEGCCKHAGKRRVPVLLEVGQCVEA